MKKWTRNEQVLVVVLVGIAALFFFSKKIHDPLSKEIASLIKENNRLVATINEMQQNPVDFTLVRKNIQKIDDELQTQQTFYDSLYQEKIYPRERTQEKALIISEILTENGLMIRELEPIAEKNKTPEKKVKKRKRSRQKAPQDSTQLYISSQHQRWVSHLQLKQYTLKMEGDFMDFLNFVDELQQQTSFAFLEKIRLQGASDQGFINVECKVIF